MRLYSARAECVFFFFGGFHDEAAHCVGCDGWGRHIFWAARFLFLISLALLARVACVLDAEVLQASPRQHFVLEQLRGRIFLRKLHLLAVPRSARLCMLQRWWDRATMLVWSIRH